MLLHLRAARIALLASTVVALAIIAPATALADSGGIDAGYGTSGSTKLPANTTFNDSLKLADGSVMAVGSSGTSTTVQIVAKFTPAGALDATFGTGGVATINALGGTNDVAHGISLRAGGGFVVVGTDDEGNTGNGTIAKLTATGAPQLGWGIAGIVVDTSVDIETGGHEIANGNVDVVGYSVNGGYAFVTRLDATGTPVATTRLPGGQGQYYPAPDPVTNPVQAVRTIGFAVLGDGHYVLSGTSTDNRPATYDFFAAIDFDAPIAQPFLMPSVTTQVPTVSTSANLTLVGATAYVAGSRNGVGTITRYNTSGIGAVDTTFGTGGVLTLAAATGGWNATDITPTANGTWYVVGNVGTTQVRTQRLTSTFAPDTTFGDRAGSSDRSFDAAGTGAVNVVVDAANRPVLVGRLGSSAATYRIERFDFAAPKLLDITYSPTFVQRLNTVTWKFPVTNSGPDASDITVDIDAPSTIEGQAFSVTSGTATPVADKSGATWTVPQLAVGATATLTLTGKPGDVGNLTVTSSVTGQSAVQVGGTPVAKTSTVMVYGAATPRDDVITGTPQRDVIDALTGNDKVYALAGNDTILGNDGDDFLDLGAGNDIGSGGNGNDVVYGQTGNDTIAGGTGNDKLRGDAGNDKVTGDDGDDVITGGDGNDRLFGGLGVDFLDGGRGDDYVHGGPGADKLYGSTGNDYLIGLTGNDALVGGPGVDRLDGDGGNDYLKGNTGNDFLNGKTGNDRIYGDAGNDWLRGFTGNDYLVGGTGNDLVNGGTGADRLFAGPGNDVIRADDGAGVDHVDCGSGWDLVYANPGDTVTADCEYVKYDVFAVAAP
ncbi:MAG: hypothetical protein H7287_02730 [Thermoleophilia bacterium]|nr:hypothetical protein [Thermoleophilia bacterium]